MGLWLELRVKTVFFSGKVVETGSLLTHFIVQSYKILGLVLIYCLQSQRRRIVYVLHHGPGTQDCSQEVEAQRKTPLSRPRWRYPPRLQRLQRGSALCSHSPTVCSHSPTVCSHSPTVCSHSPTVCSHISKDLFFH